MDVDTQSLLIDWVNGAELEFLVQKYLQLITNIEYAYESLGVYITSAYENYLPWVIGTIIAWVNGYPQEFSEGRNLLDPHISAYIRYGVNNKLAVNMMSKGIRSRRIALLLSRAFEQVIEEGYEFDSWLASFTISGLIENFNASESEIKDIIEYLNPSESTFLSDLIERQYAELELFLESTLKPGSVEFSKPKSEHKNEAIYVSRNGQKIIELPLVYYKVVDTLLETGLPYEATIAETDTYYQKLIVSIIEYGEEYLQREQYGELLE
jgi:hypothetical protein